LSVFFQKNLFLKKKAKCDKKARISKSGIEKAKLATLPQPKH